MTPHRLAPAGALLALALTFAACANGEAPTDEPPPPPTASAGEPAPSPAEPPYPLTLTDDAGRSVTVAAEPRRIVTLAPSNTEIVCALDACDRLVGVPEFLDGYPDEVLATVADLPAVVSFGPVDREAIVGVEPDLILAAGNELTPSDDIASLADLGYAVLVLYPESLDEVYADVELVGAALGAADAADALVDGLRAHQASVTDAVSGAERPRTYYEVDLFEGTIYTAGEGSFLASLIELAGGDPITGDAFGTIDPEALVAADPELIVLGNASYDPTLTDPESARDAVAARPGWGGLSAVRNGRVVPFTDDLVTTRPGPRIVEGLEALARAIHPDRFD